MLEGQVPTKPKQGKTPFSPVGRGEKTSVSKKEDSMAQPDLSIGRPVALIIGASSGIGEHLSLSLAAAGFSVALVARRQAPLEILAFRR